MYQEDAVSNALSAERLHLILLPTEKCNFRCRYCYEDFNLGKMPSEVMNGVKALIHHRIPHIRHLALSWFGGEPLLAKDVIFEVGSYAHLLAKRHGVEFDAGLTTNAYLLNRGTFSELLDQNHTHYQITLDGDEEWHDRTRLLADGAGTFSAIWSNLLSIREEQRRFSIDLRIHLHRHNIESIKRLYARIENAFLADCRYAVSFKRIVNLSGDRGIPVEPLPVHDYEAAVKYVTRTESYRNTADTRPTTFCYAAKVNSLVIRANGRIGKCTVALTDDRNDIGHLNPDGVLALDRTKLNMWFEGYKDMSSRTLSCPASALPSQLVQINLARQCTGAGATDIPVDADSLVKEFAFAVRRSINTKFPRRSAYPTKIWLTRSAKAIWANAHNKLISFREWLQRYFHVDLFNRAPSNKIL